MKVTISVVGKFHAFFLARQLESRGFLDSIITAYPRFRVLHEGIPKEKIISLPTKEFVLKIFCSTPVLSRFINIDWYLNRLFDIQASRCLRPSDIFLGWSGASLCGLRKARSQGAITLVERSSSHIEYQREILKEEYARLGLKPILPDARLAERELREYEESDYINVPSQFVKKTFLQKGIPEKKLILTPYGVDTRVFHSIPKEDDVFRVIYVGSMTVRKGLPYLLRAMSELKLKKSELWLIGSMGNDILPFARKYKDIFKFFGHTDFFQLHRYYSQGSVFVLPSVEDGFGLVILQAMACGLPVICTQNTGGPDVIQDGKEGFIVPIRDTVSLKEKIAYLYRNPEMCRIMGKNAEYTATHDFTWDRYGEMICTAFLRLLSR